MELIDVRAVGDLEMLLVWSNGHRALYRNDYLRLHCPCAACCDEWSGKRIVRAEQISKNIKIQAVDIIGLYAIRFRFSDGHQTGIFSFDLLRSICPCGACLPAKQCQKKECCGGH